MLYKDIIEINKNFQYSVNIEYDLQNEDKIKEYIPTSDVCDVLKIYIKTVLGYTKNEKRASLLIGPYGKGKSFLILTLLRIICFKKSTIIDQLLDKISKIDCELLKLIQEVYKKKIKLLPIIIDSNYYNIEQSFLMALNDSLRNFGLNDIIPNTIYDVCLKIIHEWENDKKIKAEVISQCLKINKTTLSELKKALVSYDKKSYYKFEKLYNCVVKGVPFNPMINTDIIKLYADVNRQLMEKGYSGIFIVYDEFSKTLESKNEYLSNDLKLIQDFAEYANRSSNSEQLHLCCITHKIFDTYRINKDDSLNDDFKKVSGRFKEIRFNRSLEQNYEIVSFTIQKKNKYANVKDKFIKNNKWLYDKLHDINFYDNNEENIVFNETFPLNPISVYVTVRLSEMIAQNERTMFTLISDNDRHSFNSFINNNSDGLFDASNLYDYFSQLMQNENSEIKDIYLKCEAAQKKITDNLQRNILKVLALIYMINDFTKLPPTVEMISLCLGIEENNLSISIDNLLHEKKVLKKSFSSMYLDFAYSGSKEIDIEINKFISTKGSNVIISDVLNEINDNLYIIPRRYNVINQITRFMKVIYLEEEKFLSLNSFSILCDTAKSDGLIIRIINRKKSIQSYKTHYNEISYNQNVILVVPAKYDKNIDSVALMVNALSFLQYRDDLSDTVLKQIGMIYAEKQKELNEMMDKCYRDDNITVLSCYKGTSINDISSNMFSNLYSKMPIINNEMINKNNISSQYKKARNEIIRRILKNDDCYDDLSPTSPEMTVYNSFYNNGALPIESENVILTIKNKLSKKTQERISFDEIMNVLLNPPYGLRKGIIPVYLALAISNMSDNTILYYENAEIEINPANLDKVCDNPSKYYAFVEKESIEQDKYLKKLLKIYGVDCTNSYYTNIRLCSEQMKKWAFGLPLIIKELSADDNYLKVDNRLIQIKDSLLKFDINSHELIIHDIPNIFENDFSKTVEFIKKQLNVKHAIEKYIQEIAKKVNYMFSKNYKGSINGSIKTWEEKKQINYSSVIFEGKGLELKEYFDIMSHDDISVINNISTILLGSRVEDWTSNNEEKLLKGIREFIENATTSNINTNIKENRIEISSLGETFKNNIESVIDEFSDSISNKEKIQILTDIIDKFSGRRKK